jgi:salicylate hydroxylase
MFETNYKLEGTHHPEPWVSESNASELTHLFNGWNKEVRDLLECTEGLKVTKWVVNVVRGLSTFAHGRVAVIGDAVSAEQFLSLLFPHSYRLTL